MSARSIANILKSKSAFASLLVKGDALRQLNEHYQRLIPTGLGACSRVITYDSGEVRIGANSGAVALKIKQLLPTLTESLRQEGVEVTAIRVVVQAMTKASSSGQRSQKRVDARGQAALAELADKLSDQSGSDDPLVRALQRLANRER